MERGHGVKECGEKKKSIKTAQHAARFVYLFSIFYITVSLEGREVTFDLLSIVYLELKYLEFMNE